MKKFRIKTEKEFRNEFGNLWRSTVRASFPSQMDHLLGTSLDEGDNEICENKPEIITLHMGSCFITEDMIISEDVFTSSKLHLNHFLNDDLKITLQQNN